MACKLDWKQSSASNSRALSCALSKVGNQSDLPQRENAASSLRPTIDMAGYDASP